MKRAPPHEHKHSHSPDKSMAFTQPYAPDNRDTPPKTVCCVLMLKSDFCVRICVGMHAYIHCNALWLIELVACSQGRKYAFKAKPHQTYTQSILQCHIYYHTGQQRRRQRRLSSSSSLASHTDLMSSLVLWLLWWLERREVVNGV